MEKIFVVGISFKNADVSQRSAFSLSAERREQCYALANTHGFKDFVVLDTCNRTGAGDTSDAETIILSVCCMPAEDLDRVKYVKRGQAALDHIFRVASGLDSQILGDYQILGQFRDACRDAKSHGTLGPVFERMANVCIQASKEVKSSTELSVGTASASYAVIELLRSRIGEDASCLLVGLGRFGYKVMKNIREYLPNYDLTVSNRTHATAVEAARSHGAEAVPYEQFTKHVARHDVVILSAVGQHVVIPAHISSRNRLMLDLSIPQMTHPECRDIVEVLDIDSISALLDRSADHRRQYLPVAEEIIHRHMASLVDWERFYRKRDQILSLKNTLLELSQMCPHLARMDDAARTELVNKTIQSFVLKIKHEEDIDVNQIVGEFAKAAAK